MTQAPRPIPIRAQPENPKIHFARAVHGAVLAVAGGRDVQDGISFYPEDPIVPVLLRAAVAPGSTTGWASSLAQQTTGAFMASLAPLSAASALMAMGIEIDLGRSLQVSIPGRSGPPSRLPWVGENDPLAVSQEAITAAIVATRAAGVIVVISGEVAKRANGLEVVTSLLRESAAYSLDAGYFSTAAGDDTTHAGLLNGVTATPAGGSTMQDDLSALARAAGAGGSGQIVFITGPGRFAAISVWNPDLRGSVLPSLAVPEDRVIAVDPLSLVHGVGAEPEISASNSALIHMDDVPEPIVASATVAAPVRSLWQTNAIALSCRIDVGFAKRRSGAVAYMDGITVW